MANVTDKSILTAAGKALLAQLNAEEKALVIDKMIFANVPNRPEYPQPDDVVPSNDVVHEAAVEQRGRLSVDSVIYSTTLTSQEGPFEFNWTGAYCSEYGVLVTIDHHALTPKTADEPGVSGNTLVRSVVLEYKDIAEITNITVDASTWQYNATPRMKKMDDDVAQANIDQNGKDWFIEDGFLVTPQASAFNIKAGAGYVSGNRVTLEFDRNVQVPNKPSFIYVDAHREGTPTGEQVTLFDFVVTAEEKDDYTDANGVKHFVCKIAQVLADGSVSDLRPEGESASREYVDDNIGWLAGKVWKEGGEIKDPNQLYVFKSDSSSPAYDHKYYAPTATENSPVVMGDTPIGDDNFIQINGDLANVAISNNVDYKKATYLLKTKVKDALLFFHKDTQSTFRALSPLSGNITHIKFSEDTVDVTVDGSVVTLIPVEWYELRKRGDARGWGAKGDYYITQLTKVALAVGTDLRSIVNPDYTNNTPFVQQCIDDGGELRFDYGAYAFDSEAIITEGIGSIKGIDGGTRIVVTSGTAAFKPSGRIVAESLRCTGIYFESAVDATGCGIGSDTDQYLSHWDITNCYFDRSLRYGVKANIVGCNILNNKFGIGQQRASQVFKAIEAIGEPSDQGDPVPLLPNANFIMHNWIIRGCGVDSIIHIRAGVQNVIQHNLIESNEASDTLIKIEGDMYPKVSYNYFEKVRCPSLVKIYNDPNGVSDTLLLEFDNNHIRGKDTQLQYLLDFDGVNSVYHTFNKNIVNGVQETLLGIVRERDGSIDTGAGCLESIGSTIFGRTGNFYNTLYGGAYKIRELLGAPKIVSTKSYNRIELVNPSGSAFFGQEGALSSSYDMPFGGNFYFRTGGEKVVRVRPDNGFTSGRDNAVRLGDPSERYTDAYLVNNPTVGSDGRIKKGRASIPQELCDFAMAVEIEQYRLKDGQSGRNHFGIVITEEFLSKLETIYSIDDCAALCHSVFVDVDGQPIKRTFGDIELGEIWQLRYTEWQNILLEAMRRKFSTC
ncbi:phage tail protein [Vibrio splendidus]